MEIITFLILLIIAVPVVKTLSAKSSYDKSQYGQVSGNKLFKTIFDKGNYGEFLTFRMLEKLGEKYILTNIYIPRSDGSTTEIDLLMLNEKGIYVLESKNYSGWIFGDEKSKMWTQTLKGGKKSRFFNPIWQNKAHITALDEYLDRKYTNLMYSFIIFSERCELKKISYTSSNVVLLKRNQLIKNLRNHMEELPASLSGQEVESIYTDLKSKTLASDEAKAQHINEIKSKH